MSDVTQELVDRVRRKTLEYMEEWLSSQGRSGSRSENLQKLADDLREKRPTNPGGHFCGDFLDAALDDEKLDAKARKVVWQKIAAGEE